jgi:uncharacterized membrane protein
VDSSTILQILLLINVFLMGSLTAIAIRHAYAHFKPHDHDAEKLRAANAVTQAQLPASVKERLVREAQANYLAVLNHSANELQEELHATAEQLNKQLAEIGAEVNVSERGRYTTMLEDIRQKTEEAINNARSDITGHQVDLKAKLAEQMGVEQKALLQQIDTKLGDAVASFLTETLQHNVDLGAQSAYLMSVLEEHKDEFKREVQDDAAAAAK